MGSVREVDEEGGSRPNNLIKVLPRFFPSGAALWVRNQVVDGSDAEKLEGVHVSFMLQVTGMKDQRLGARLGERRGRIG